ncbi:hypothetical protein FJ692_17885 [Pseudomonas fluorescens]|nr:hypothetical protein C1751_21575 [Pseudomonas fluorescens]TPV55597.1 hypothetical protein FJ692_17885 [Pseudomonas fluorescens]
MSAVFYYLNSESCKIYLTKQIKCGSWLACDGGVSVIRPADCYTAIAGKPAPTLLLFALLQGR